MAKPKQVVTKLLDPVLCDALQSYARQHYEGNESMVVRKALRDLLLPAETVPVHLPLPGREKPSPLTVVKPKGGQSRVSNFLHQYGELASDG